ncbi:TPA: hypothetical protein HA317_03870 [Candidatus Woesearchaeota archaeon]|nr:hypothetical protein [Candidatus Woesearchaeota archaeon]
MVEWRDFNMGTLRFWEDNFVYYDSEVASTINLIKLRTSLFINGAKNLAFDG